MQLPWKLPVRTRAPLTNGAAISGNRFRIPDASKARLLFADICGAGRRLSLNLM